MLKGFLWKVDAFMEHQTSQKAGSWTRLELLV